MSIVTYQITGTPTKDLKVLAAPDAAQEQEKCAENTRYGSQCYFRAYVGR